VFLIVFLHLYIYLDNGVVKWIKTPVFKWFLDYPEEYHSEPIFWEFKERLTDIFKFGKFINRNWLFMVGD